MKLKQLLLIVSISAGSALASVWGYNKFTQHQTEFVQTQGGLPVNYAGFFDKNTSGDPVDFSKAANSSVQAVVHIKTKIPAKKLSNDIPRSRGFFDDFFNDMLGPQIIPEQKASGSGVIISEDGYIVTNNHVISDGDKGVASEINVTLHNRKTYKARVIGYDPNYDLAVLKIDGAHLPFMLYGNSDEVQLGQWVLAVGYPLSLETTVTAGIVSAKGRTIGINSRQGQAPVESFIQTDAAVNQGNSGGALVNTNGQLIGINSAILAPSGTYAGYSFAIPVNLVKKVVSDIIQYGNVQRGYLGVSYPTQELSEEQMKQLGIQDSEEGVYVSAVAPDGAAQGAGIKRGDLITKINGTEVTSGLEMSSVLANYKPGDKVQVTYKRKGSELTTAVVLRKSPGNYDAVVSANVEEQLGADLETLDSKKADQYGIDGGVVVKTIKKGGAISKTRMEEGFIITSVNGVDVKNVEQLGKALLGARGTVKLEGMYPGSDMYTYPLNLNGD
ncbi:MAG TPA: trypsin-like peptidase domain-containing protein [Chitinophagaceae bacterium]|jgi:Do/DeqQ family serine protease|nr:trypsin-like peptidase domain-containing protein [Chitinophagaceae bacterium]